jgi:wyosine [tRNA(Phe)-imidazoG37] synthetase (radical SAM superfamily)
MTDNSEHHVNDNVTGDRAIQLHPRVFEQNRYVYPVLSRRARGVSIGINLNPDRICNLDCVYCQVDRTRPSLIEDVDRATIREELLQLLGQARSGALYRHPAFVGIQDSWRRLNDVALSGDGEPTTYSGFLDVVRDALAVLRDNGFSGTKLILITNGSLLRRPDVREALTLIDAAGGEIWAKLDAGTEEYYQVVCRTQVKYKDVLRNILQTAKEHPIIIQSCFMRIDGQGPNNVEIGAYVDRLKEIIASDGKIRGAQVYTIARKPSEPYVTPLSDREIDHIVRRVGEESGVPATGFYSHS